jgi:hypothetical protein
MLLYPGELYRLLGASSFACMLFFELENDTFGLNQTELINEIKIKCSRFVDKMIIGCFCYSNNQRE